MTLACTNQTRGGFKTDFCAQNKAEDAFKSSQLLVAASQKDRSRAWLYVFELRIVMETLQCMPVLILPEDMVL